MNVRQLVQEIPSEFLECRSLGHAWKYFRVDSAKGNGRRYKQRTICMRCDTERWQFLSAAGKIKGGAYFYPKHYLIEGIGFLTQEERAWIRLRAAGL